MNDDFICCKGAQYALYISYEIHVDNERVYDARLKKISYDWKYIDPEWIDKLVYFDIEESLTGKAFYEWKQNNSKIKIKEIKIHII